MMKKLLQSVILFFFSAYVLGSPIIWATYFVYQDYIAEEFCVNKQNPDCCGKCYVADVTDEAPKKELPKIEVRTPEISSFILNTLHHHAVDHQSLVRFSPFHPGLTSNGFDEEIIEPPEAYRSLSI